MQLQNVSTSPSRRYKSLICQLHSIFSEALVLVESFDYTQHLPSLSDWFDGPSKWSLKRKRKTFT